MNFSLDSIGYNISEIIYAIILLFAIVLRKILSNYFQVQDSLLGLSKTKKRSQKLWIGLLRENKQLDNYLIVLNQLQKNNNLKSSSIYYLIASGFFFFIYFILIIIFKSRFDFWHSMAYISLAINIPSFVITVLIMRYMYIKLIDCDKIYDKSVIIANLIYSTKYYILSSNVIYLLMLLLIWNKSKYNFSTDDVLLIGAFEMSFALAIVAYYQLILAKKDFIGFIKSAINKEISNKCSHITVTTDEREIAGNIIDIFDDEIIVLDEKGYKSIAKWVDIVGYTYLRK